MNGYVAWMAAEAEPLPIPLGKPERRLQAEEREEEANVSRRSLRAEDLPAHGFPGRVAIEASEAADFPPQEPELWVYRKRTVRMLQRYMRYSLETGRLPSLVGREFFRSQVTKYVVTTFEDRVIFVHDMERCLERLDEFSRQVLGRVVLQEYEHEQAARLLGCTRMTVHRKLLESLDALSEILLEMELLDSVPSRSKKSCQGGKSDDFPASDCERGK